MRKLPSKSRNSKYLQDGKLSSETTLQFWRWQHMKMWLPTTALKCSRKVYESSRPLQRNLIFSDETVSISSRQVHACKFIQISALYSQLRKCDVSQSNKNYSLCNNANHQQHHSLNQGKKEPTNQPILFLLWGETTCHAPEMVLKQKSHW